MGRFEEDARFAVAQSVAQRTVAAGAVRVEQVAVPFSTHSPLPQHAAGVNFISGDFSARLRLPVSV